MESQGTDNGGVSPHDLGFGHGFRRILRVYAATVEAAFYQHGENDFVDVDMIAVNKNTGEKNEKNESAA